MLGLEISTEETRTLLFASEHRTMGRYFEQPVRNPAYTMGNTAEDEDDDEMPPLVDAVDQDDDVKVYGANGVEEPLPAVAPLISKVAAMSAEDAKVCVPLACWPYIYICAHIYIRMLLCI